MEELNKKITKLRKNYREIFVTCGDEIEKRINELKPENFGGEFFQKYEPGSDGYKWQISALELLDNEISREIYRKLNEILAYRSQFKCVGCATCCKLACSEFSPEELKRKADNGDNFAGQFLSIFIPYDSKEDARKIYPEYIELLEQTGNEKVYFYHCPKLTKENRCSDYGNRPQICRDFPDNPFSILPKACGYNEWKEEIEPIALMLHSMLEITDYYRTKLDELL